MIEIIKSENKKTLKLSFDENNMPVLEVEYWDLKNVNPKSIVNVVNGVRQRIKKDY